MRVYTVVYEVYTVVYEQHLYGYEWEDAVDA